MAVVILYISHVKIGQNEQHSMMQSAWPFVHQLNTCHTTPAQWNKGTMTNKIQAIPYSTKMLAN